MQSALSCTTPHCAPAALKHHPCFLFLSVWGVDHSFRYLKSLLILCQAMSALNSRQPPFTRMAAILARCRGSPSYRSEEVEGTRTSRRCSTCRHPADTEPVSGRGPAVHIGISAFTLSSPLVTFFFPLPFFQLFVIRAVLPTFHHPVLPYSVKSPFPREAPTLNFLPSAVAHLLLVHSRTRNESLGELGLASLPLLLV